MPSPRVLHGVEGSLDVLVGDGVVGDAQDLPAGLAVDNGEEVLRRRQRRLVVPATTTKQP